ncbi:ATP-binding protein, partial [Candidatus Woesearchaeota archaeon]|nr:ATP-binding protein [Candidatus Woesearchaeota archaeon]
MNIKEITEYLVDFQHREFPSLIKRDLEIKETKKIISIIGPRRAGKTYFIYQSMEEMLKDMKRENLIYLNFEDTRLLGITFKDIKEIIKLQWKLYPNSMKKLVVFIDEPQNIKNWEHAVRSLYDEGFKIFLTGSSSKLLSKEIASSLRGRTLSYLLMPFSFREVLKLKKFECSFNKLSSKERSLLDYYLDNYIKLGGFPEILIEEDKQTQIKILKEYLDLIVYRDVVERYNLKNTKLIQWLIKCLIASFSKEFSVHKTYLTLKSQGIKVSKNTLYTYVSLLEDSLFAFFIPSFSQSQRKKGFSINKVYINDIGFVNLLEVSTDRGKRMENIVFLELQRRKSPLT